MSYHRTKLTRRPRFSLQPLAFSLSFSRLGGPTDWLTDTLGILLLALVILLGLLL